MKSIYLIITFAFFAICKIEEPNQDIIISITKRPLQIPLNYNSMFSVETDFLDNENIFDISDIQEKTNFDSFLSERNSNKYNISCHLWKPKDANLRIFCTLKEKIPKEINFLKMEEISSFIYKDANIQIKPSVSLEVYVSETEEPNIAFLYSDKQVIIIEDKIESYELKFNIGQYHDEFLQLTEESGGAGFILYDCKKDKNELICPVSKTKLEAISAKNPQKFVLMFLLDRYSGFQIPSVLDISFEFPTTEKKEILVWINKLLIHVIGSYSMIAFETNITNIGTINTADFGITFEGNEEDFPCRFVKYDESPLYLMCTIYNSGNISVGIINDEITEDYLSYKYIFRLQPSTINETVFVDEESKNGIYLSFPEFLDFSTKETQYLYYVGSQISNFEGVKLDKNSPDLVCEEDGKNVKKCIVSKSHFKTAKNGFYYTYYKNPLNETSILYDIPPVQIKFTSDGPKGFSRFNKFSMIFVSLFLVLYL